MYVWIEAVVGYLSASIEWAKNNGQPEAWREWWTNPDARAYYFIGKDNIPFHAIIWPAELMGYNGDMNLPYDIPANEFLNLEGQQLSTSRNWAVWVPDYLERYAADPLRYYLTAVAPETRDSEFSWSGYLERNNNELVATWGNLVNRVISFANRHWEGVVPTPGDLDERDRAIIATIDGGFETVGNLYAKTEFRAALREAIGLAREVNRYLDETSPWFAGQTGQGTGRDVGLRRAALHRLAQAAAGAGPAAHVPARPRVPRLRAPALRRVNDRALPRVRTRARRRRLPPAPGGIDRGPLATQPARTRPRHPEANRPLPEAR